jgi:EAL domain-containing protein (putative c-di-GMP-specific phosphodiesterase class I)
MYRVKSLGGGSHQLFDPNMHTRAVKLLQLENNLRRAVNTGDFELHYQPIVSIPNGTTQGFEALIRWPHATMGLLMPGEFIGLAEETGLIVAMGEWVLRTACRQLSQWQKQFKCDPPLTMSVNVSYKQFVQTDFVEVVRRVIEETGIEPNTLCLEITESGLMRNPDIFIPLIAQLQRLRVQMYLYYLHRFKIDKLKIDRSFVSHMEAPDENFEVLKSIISLAHNLKIDVIAEGIETESQLRRLRELQCQYGQGYYLSRPGEAKVVSAFIGKKMWEETKK